LLADGIDACPEHQILEYFLFAYIPMKDTNPLAHGLIERFGSLSKVFDTDYEALRSVKGMTDTAAAAIALHNRITNRINVDRLKKQDVLDTAFAVFRYAAAFMQNLAVEETHLLCLNGVFKLIKRVRLQRGIVNQTAVYLRQIALEAMQCGATNIIILHNHPSGNVFPSQSDIDVSREMLTVFPSLEINLLDHIIIGVGGEYYSFRDNQEFLRLRNGSASRYAPELNDAFNVWNGKKDKK
jgi:DNA repair protein RadC